MSQNKSSFNLEDLKNAAEQIKQAKKEYEEKEEKGEIQKPKQTLANKIVGIIVLVAILALVIVVVILNLDTLLMPKNSVTFEVKNQNGEVVEGLEIHVSSSDNLYTIEYDKDSSISETVLDVKPGEYEVRFEIIPENYTCSKILDNFTMNDGDKIKLEYECTKDN